MLKAAMQACYSNCRHNLCLPQHRLSLISVKPDQRKLHTTRFKDNFNHIAIKAAVEANVAHAVDSNEVKAGVMYNHPQLYDEAFSFRDFGAEVSFLKDAYSHHTNGAPLTSVLDLGCGTGRHSLALAAGGVPRVVGLDNCKEMLQYVEKKAQAAGVLGPLVLQEADMRTFRLEGAPVDMVMCLLGTFTHMLENQDALACLSSSHAALRDGGLMVLELPHPGDLFDGTLILGDGGKEAWEVPSSIGTNTLVEWGAECDNFDPATQVLYRSMSITVLNGEEVVQQLEETIPQRQFTCQELDLMGRITGFKVVGSYGEMRLDTGLEHEEAYRLVAVLQKTP